MRRPAVDAPGFSRLDIGRAVAVMAALVMAVGAALERRDGEGGYPEPVPQGEWAPAVMSEAEVFRLGTEDLAVAPGFVVARSAHPRTLDFSRRLRAYPGAPPRVPHGLTREEYERNRCNACHERGGWVARFGTYAPVTPHPDQSACLQCHVPQDELVGRPLPEPGALVCMQCHVDPDRPPATFVATDWRAASWPRTELHAMPGSPNVVPHDVVSRANCLACHGGPGAVAELRTDHPERVNCRQCHVPSGDALGGISDTDAGPASAEAGPVGADQGVER